MEDMYLKQKKLESSISSNFFLILLKFMEGVLNARVNHLKIDCLHVIA